MRKENGIYTYKWDALDDDGPILKITKSSVGTYGFCPLSYKYSYLEDVKQKTSPAMLKGTIIHNAEEDFWKVVDIKKAVDLEPSEMTSYFRSLYPEAPAEDYEDIYRAMSAYNTERLMESIEEDTVDNYIPIGNEIMVDADITFDDTEIHLQGIIDRVFYENGGYILMELKTGVWKDTKRTNMRKEMAFYKFLFEQAEDETIRELGLDPDVPITHWGWYFPASNFVYAEEVSKRSTTAMKNSLSRLINAYKENDFPAAYYYNKCVHCGHYDHCEAASGGSQYEWF
jgi:hypothetical protein